MFCSVPNPWLRKSKSVSDGDEGGDLTRHLPPDSFEPRHCLHWTCRSCPQLESRVASELPYSFSGCRLALTARRYHRQSLRGEEWAGWVHTQQHVVSKASGRSYSQLATAQELSAQLAFLLDWSSLKRKYSASECRCRSAVPPGQSQNTNITAAGPTIRLPRLVWSFEQAAPFFNVYSTVVSRCILCCVYGTQSGADC